MSDVQASSTPILDSGVLPPRHLQVRPQALLAAIVIGVILMEALAMAGGLWHEHWPLIFLLLFLLAIAVHEVGHLVAGWAAGFHFNSIQIGPLLLENEYGSVRTHFSLDMMAFGYSGMHADSVRKLRRRMLVYIAGGPAANLLSVIAIVVISHLMPPSDSRLATAVGLFGAVSLVFVLISLAPIATNDGGLIEILFSSPLLARRFISTVALGAQFNQGIRAKNWKQTWLNAATYVPDRSPSDFYAGWMAYLSANDRKDGLRSAQYLERCLSLTPLLTSRLRSLVAQEAFVYCAWHRRDRALSEKWLTQVNSRSQAQIVQARIDVALCCARSDFENAAAACDKAITLFSKMPTKPYLRALQESWIEWRAEIEERRTELKENEEVPALP